MLLLFILILIEKRFLRISDSYLRAIDGRDRLIAWMDLRNEQNLSPVWNIGLLKVLSVD